MRPFLFLAVFAPLARTGLAAEDCKLETYDEYTDDFHWTASSDRGVPGDVVAVDFTLHIEKLHTRPIAVVLVGCYDHERAELLGEPSYSEFFDRIFYITNFWPAGDPPRPVSPAGKKGFIISAEVKRAGERYFRDGLSLPFATLYFRLKGRPGEEFQVGACDDEFIYYPYYQRGPSRNGEGCLRNHIYYSSAVEGQLIALSTRHEAGVIRILEGEPTRPDPPAQPPLAKIYPEAPTPETARIEFELTGGAASPSDRDVPIDFFVTSSHEASGFSAGIKFPAEHLELARVEERTRPGLVQIDNQAGTLALMMRNSRRRIASEGERVRIATLYFNVREEAAAADEARLKFEPVGAFVNWLVIHWRGGVAPDILPVETTVEPLTIREGLLKLAAPREFVRGDWDGDGGIDLTDAKATLLYLYVSGDSPPCPDAADANDDGKLNLTDPITVLHHLFLGGPRPPAPYPVAGEDPTSDSIRC